MTVEHHPTDDSRGPEADRAHTRLVLSGDFDTPEAVLASDLAEDEKAEILNTWLKDIDRSDPVRHREVRDGVAAALARLRPDAG